MRIVRIDLSGIASLQDLYAELEHALGLPGHFGRNLDALWDVLTGDVAGPIQIEFTGRLGLRRRLGDDAQHVLDLFAEVAAERDDFAVAMLD